MKSFFKKNFYLILIVLTSIIFRFLFLDKAGGLGYDEIIGTYKEASQPDILSVITYTLKMDINLPLYQIILHCWSKIFSFSDYSMRAFSAVCGVLTVITSYFVGKELSSKQTGLICASIFAINSFLIYYSQEVRMYGFMALLSTIFLLFLVKLKNNYKNKWNYLGLILSAFAVMISHTLSAIFIFIQIFAIVAYLFYKGNGDKKLLQKPVLIVLTILTLLYSPFLIYMIQNQSKYSNFYGGAYFDLSSLFVIAQNWFSPILNQTNPPHYIKMLVSSLNLSNIIFIFIPIILCIEAIIVAIKKDKFAMTLFISVLLFLTIEVIAVYSTNFKLIPRYTMVIVPNLLILAGYGFSLISNKKHLKTIIFSVFIIINFVYLALYNDAAFRLPREGFRSVAQVLISNDVKDNDFVVVWNNRTVLSHYIDKKINVIGLLPNIAYTSEIILQNEMALNKLSLEKRKLALRPYFASNYIPVNNIYLIDSIYDVMKPGQKFIITTKSFFNSFTQKSFTELVQNDKNYETISYNNLLTIKALINIKEICNRKFHFIKTVEDAQSNTIIIFFAK